MLLDKLVEPHHRALRLNWNLQIVETNAVVVCTTPNKIETRFRVYGLPDRRSSFQPGKTELWGILQPANHKGDDWFD